MQRIFAAFVEIIAAAVVLVPVLLIYRKVCRQDWKRTVGYAVFLCYLVAVSSLVGLPSVVDFHMDLNCNLIPFAGIVADFRNCILNVCLFIPFGFLVPCLWERYRVLKRTALLGFAVSMVIELLQIFTFRATDVNDLITNVLGTVIGYMLANAAIRRIPGLKNTSGSTKELYILFAIVMGMMAFIQPWISMKLWEVIL